MNRSESQKTLFSLIEDNAWIIYLLGIPALAAFFAHLANWSPSELIGLIAVLVAAGIVTTGLLFWRRVRLAQAEGALKQEMLQRGLTPDEIERLLRLDSTPTQPVVPPLTDDQAIAELVGSMGTRQFSAADMEQILAAVMAVEPCKRQVVCASLLRIVDSSDADPEKQMLAVVRGLTSGGS